MILFYLIKNRNILKMILLLFLVPQKFDCKKDEYIHMYNITAYNIKFVCDNLVCFIQYISET